MEDREQEILEKEQELKGKIQNLKNLRVVKEMKNKLYMLPIGVMAGSLAFMYFGRKISTNRSKLMIVGLGLFGGLVGGQLSGFWLKSQYDKMDPEGKVFNEILEIGKESQNLKRLKCSIGKRLE